MSPDEHRGGPAKPKPVPDDEPVLPVLPRDETGEGWGDAHDLRDEEWYRRERPPHHE